jgi:hypothetical protein
MKTFTLRELDRTPAAVLEACDREGAVRIRRRNGRSYTIRPEDGPSRKVTSAERLRWLAGHNAWLKQTFPQPISIKQTVLVDRLIAGE